MTYVFDDKLRELTARDYLILLGRDDPVQDQILRRTLFGRVRGSQTLVDCYGPARITAIYQDSIVRFARFLFFVFVIAASSIEDAANAATIGRTSEVGDCSARMEFNDR